MTKFRVYYTTVKSAHIDVDAENLNEAIDLAEKRESEIFINNDGALDFDPYTYDFNKCMEWKEEFDDFDYKETTK